MGDPEKMSDVPKHSTFKIVKDAFVYFLHLFTVYIIYGIIMIYKSIIPTADDVFFLYHLLPFSVAAARADEEEEMRLAARIMKSELRSSNDLEIDL